jgi:putative DNA primase/helicase
MIAEPVNLTDAPAHLVKQSAAAWHFAQMAGDRVRFDHGRARWLLWAGHRWQPDQDGSVERVWLEVLADRYRRALVETGELERARRLAEVQAAGATNSAVNSGLELAASMEPIATRADAWDPDPMLLGCPNGVVDLRTGELRDGRPEDMISRSTLVDFDPSAGCPRWLQFLPEVFAGDVELCGWFELLIGSALIGKSKELLPVWHGRGNNGKSVASRTLRRAFGEYATSISIETLTDAKRRAGEATPDLVNLRGARLAFATEPDRSAKLRGGTMKKLVSIDPITGRGLYAGSTSWEPTHTLALVTNHLPSADDATPGFWRRVAAIPWNVRFGKPGEPGLLPEDPDLADTLATEAPGILAWAVRGAVEYAAGRSLWPLPATVLVKTAAYRSDQDKLGAFVESRVVYEAGATVTLGRLFEAYEEWCAAEGVPVLERFKSRAFGSYLEDRGGVERFKDSGGWIAFTGARLAGDLARPTLLVLPEPIEPEEAPPTPEPPNTISCRDYSNHQFRHVRDGDGWRCLDCEPLA